MDAVEGPGFAALPERERLTRTARELEAVVITQLLDTMRASVPEGGLFEKSAADDIFRSMFDSELARKVAEKSPFGLADAIVERYGDRLGNETAPSGPAGGTGPARSGRSWRV